MMPIMKSSAFADLDLVRVRRRQHGDKNLYLAPEPVAAGSVTTEPGQRVELDGLARVQAVSVLVAPAAMSLSLPTRARPASARRCCPAMN
jgi:hypothetical protein